MDTAREITQQGIQRRSEGNIPMSLSIQILIPKTLSPITHIPRLERDNRKFLIFLSHNTMTTFLHPLNPFLQVLYLVHIRSPRHQERQEKQSQDGEQLRFWTVKERSEGMGSGSVGPV